MINNVTLIGRLTKDVELKRTPSDIAAAQFTIACNRNFKNSNGECGVNKQNALQAGPRKGTL